MFRLIFDPVLPSVTISSISVTLLPYYSLTLMHSLCTVNRNTNDYHLQGRGDRAFFDLRTCVYPKPL